MGRGWEWDLRVETGAMELWKQSRGNDGNANGFSDTVKHTVEVWSSNQILLLTTDMKKNGLC